MIVQCTGMLSKSLGQSLRVAASLHVLFHFLALSDVSQGSIVPTISEQAIVAAMDLVEVCCQQTAYITGRGDIKTEIDLIEAGIWFSLQWGN